MALYGESFLQILQDTSPISYGSSVQVSQNSSVRWDDDDDSFEVSEVMNAASSDTNLADALRSIDATHDSVEVQSPTQTSVSEPSRLNRTTSLKEDLKTKIQTRRKSEGVGELRVQFEAPKSYPLTAEEKDKIQKRKHRNRVSANRSRIKRQKHEDTLLKEVEELERENDKLSKDVKFLHKIKDILSSKLTNHRCTKPDMTSSVTRLRARRNDAGTSTQTTVSQLNTNSDFSYTKSFLESLTS